ncbi:hypothetical protein DNTS_022986 [Danionella cerebrum]|uniref:EF-hand domain-containing protein n=1 Tax=Danionella cerebrum TaxID=2873325 RepID=A0A553RB73_9TELE|nr:hypothetical protein DNTS_022986 [Danionella translucida]
MGSKESELSLLELFHACDVDRSGRIEKREFVAMCSELHVRSSEIDELFSRLDADSDGSINLKEFMAGFQESSLLKETEMKRLEAGESFSAAAWRDFQRRLGEHLKYISRPEQVSTLHQNICLTEPRLLPQFERVLLDFIREIQILNAEIEHLALAVKRAQDQMSIRLSEMEDEMDQRIQTTERNARLQESKKAEWTLNSMKQQFEGQISELQQKVLTLQKQNQKLKQELLETHTYVGFLQSELDALKSDFTDQSLIFERASEQLLNRSLALCALMTSSEQDILEHRVTLRRNACYHGYCQTEQRLCVALSQMPGSYRCSASVCSLWSCRDEAMMKCFSDERENLERQIEVLHAANRKLHDSNDSLRTSLENSRSQSKSRRLRGLPPGLYISSSTRKSLRSSFFDRANTEPDEDEDDAFGDSFALALCDPMRRHSFEEDSLPDSGTSTLRSHTGLYYESERTFSPNTGQAEDGSAVTASGDTSDTEVMDVQDDAALGSDRESVLSWSPSKPDQTEDVSASGKKCLSAVVSEREQDTPAAARSPSEKAYRVVLAGDAAVGKSSFLLRLCKNEFKSNTSATLGVDFQMKTLVVDGVETVLQLWDTAGQERFRSIAKSYFRRADGVLLLYDVTCEKSFLNVREWVSIIEDVSQDGIPIMIVGNKTDLRNPALQDVTSSCGEKLAMVCSFPPSDSAKFSLACTYSALFCETSAKDGSNIIEAVLHLAREVTKHSKETKEKTSVTKLSGNQNRKLNNSSCCTG